MRTRAYQRCARGWDSKVCYDESNMELYREHIKKRVRNNYSNWYLEYEKYKESFNFAKANNPLVIISDLPDEEFLPFIKKELRNKKLHSTEYYKITKLQPSSKNICYER